MWEWPGISLGDHPVVTAVPKDVPASPPSQLPACPLERAQARSVESPCRAFGLEEVGYFGIS